MNKYRKHYTEQRAVKRQLLSELKKEKQRKTENRRMAKTYSEARDLVNNVMIATQRQVGAYFEDVITLALASVYGKEYSFKLDYKMKRNQTEAEPLINKGGKILTPYYECGEGLLNIISFAWRVASWFIKEPRTDSVFLLDEPGKGISKGLLSSFGEMIRKVSDMFKIQMIIITHETELEEFGDKCFKVWQNKNGISYVKEIKV